MQPEVQLLKTTDGDKLKELISVFEAVFEMERLDRPSATYLGHLLNKGSFFAVVALAGNKVIAGLTAYVLDQYYSEKPLMYLYDLGVLPEYQRMGVGRKLMAFTHDYCRQKGFAEMYVQADREDIHALDFYRSMNPTNEASVVQFSYRM